MFIAPIQPPVTTLPVEPMPPAPASDLIARYGDQLRALGAAELKVVDAETVALTFFNNFAGVQAAGALNEVVDGVKLLVQNRSITADYWEPTGANVAAWLGQSSLVEKVDIRETFPMQLSVTGTSGRNESALATLLRTQLDDGTSVNVQRRMWIL